MRYELREAGRAAVAAKDGLRREAARLSATAVGPRRILIVESDAVYRQGVAVAMREHFGCQITDCGTVDEVFRGGTLEDFDLVVAGLHSRDAGELLRMVRLASGRSDVPVVVVSPGGAGVSVDHHNAFIGYDGGAAAVLQAALALLAAGHALR